MPSSAPEDCVAGAVAETHETHHALHYKKHGALEVPTNGTLVLDASTLAFRGGDRDDIWSLHKLDVEHYRGRTSHGMKVLRAWPKEGEEPLICIFTQVDGATCERIRDAVAAAKEEPAIHRKGARRRRHTERSAAVEAGDGEDAASDDDSHRRRRGRRHSGHHGHHSHSRERSHHSRGDHSRDAHGDHSKGDHSEGDRSKGDEPELHLKNVMYYKDGHHSRMSTPVRGTLSLRGGALSFHSQVHDYRWNLTAVTVTSFKGRMNHGMKILGPREILEEEAALQAWTEAEGGQVEQDTEEYAFTHVDAASVYAIQRTVAAAKEEEAEEKKEAGEGLAGCCDRAWRRLQAAAAALMGSRQKVHSAEGLEEPLTP